MKNRMKKLISLLIVCMIILSNTVVSADNKINIEGEEKEKIEITAKKEEKDTNEQNDIEKEEDKIKVDQEEKEDEVIEKIEEPKETTSEIVTEQEEVKTEAIKEEQETRSTTEAKKTLEDGTYVIRSSINEKFVLDVLGASQNNGANVQLYEYSADNQKRFKVTYLGDGYYSIVAVHSNKALDVKDASKQKGANVWQYEQNGTDAQKWMIKKTENGYYSIISKCNGLYVDVLNANASNYTNIQMCDGNGLKAQQFKFEKVVDDKQGDKNPPIIGTQTIPNGTYVIRSAINEKFVLDVLGASQENGANVQLYEYSADNQKRYQVTYLGDGYYSMVATHSNKSLAVKDSSKKKGANVYQWEQKEEDNQKWVIKEAGNGYYSIISKCNGLYMDVDNAKASNYTNIQMCDGNGLNAQKFKFEKVKDENQDSNNQGDNNSAVIGTKTIEDGTYVIRSAINQRYVLDVLGASQNNGANVQLYEYSEDNQKKFRVKYLGDGYYSMVAVHSNKALDVKDASQEKGANVWQWEQNRTDAQKWIIKEAGEGYYNIISKCNGLYMDVLNGNASNYSNIQMCDGNGLNAQKFSFTSLNQWDGIDVSEFNKGINWSAVKNSGQVDYAMIRAGYRGYGSGKLVTDMQFLKNITGAKANGIKIGLYFFTQAITVEEAIEEANYVLDLVKRYRIEVTYPIAIDTEYSGSSDYSGRADNLDVETRTAICNAFVETIEKAGYKAAIYASRNWFYEKLDVSQLTRGDIWVAHYTSAAKTDYKYRYHMWQYTSSGSIPGINERVDLNISYKKY